MSFSLQPYTQEALGLSIVSAPVMNEANVMWIMINSSICHAGLLYSIIKSCTILIAKYILTLQIPLFRQIGNNKSFQGWMAVSFLFPFFWYTCTSLIKSHVYLYHIHIPIWACGSPSPPLSLSLSLSLSNTQICVLLEAVNLYCVVNPLHCFPCCHFWPLAFYTLQATL